MPGEVEERIVKLEEGMARAIVENDAEAIGRFLDDDWVIIDSERGGIITKSDFLGAVALGALSHELMEFDDWRIRVYNADAAVATCRARSKGKYVGEAFSTHERSTSVYAKLNRNWQCVFTQLTAIGEK